ncbi:Hypothetical predicted protein [Olea europaea subsp. europaea]|uniref:Uncharacterized protein n=1 Tax=Olea europaea subsp. europaea TaxID=158383 RepID=A0A8S0TBH3_OLEEU|nr:Hypothetical predicted protein [Olea europaea subsp. europaea]
MQFGDTGDAGTSPRVQSHTPKPRLLMITDGCKGHSSNAEDDDDDDIVDTPPKRKKTHSRFYPPTEEHATREYYLTEPEGHDIHTSPQAQATHADDEPQPALKDLKSQLLDLKRDRNSQIDQLIRVQGEIRLDMTKIRSSMTFLFDSITALISSMMDTIVAKAIEKSEVHSVGDVPQQEKGNMDPADKIEYPSFHPTPSFDLGVASTPIISNEVDAIIASVVKDCKIEEQADVTTKIVNEEQSLYVIGAGKQIKHSDDAIVFDKHADEADVVAFQNLFNRGYKPRTSTYI